MIMYCWGVRLGSKIRFTAESIEAEKSPHPALISKTPSSPNAVPTQRHFLRLDARRVGNGRGDITFGRNQFNMLNIMIEKA